MTENNGQTIHPERYEFSPTTHPQVAQRVYLCREDGNLVVDLAAHDLDHEEKEWLHQIVASIAGSSEPSVEIVEPAPEAVTSSPLTSKKSSSTGRNIVKVTEP